MTSSGSHDHQIDTADLTASIRDAAFFRSLVEHGSDAIVSIDESNTIIYANESVERVFGYEPSELVGERLTKIMPDRFHGAHFEAFDEYLETGERTLDWNGIRLPSQHKDGHEVPLSITFEEHVYEGERVFSGIMRDVSEEIERKERLERQNERLDRFASIVSHDLRDPLNTARATTRLVEAGQTDAVDDLYDIYDRMEALVDDMLVLAREGETVGETEAVDLESVVEAAFEVAHRGSASLTVDGDLPTVEADPGRLETLFQNLFRNAVEHGGDDVTVRVAWVAEADGVLVADDGPGFGDADADRLFEYGYTTTDDGTGYGLNIVAEIAEAHGWDVAASEAGGGGARFDVTGLTVVE